MIMSDTQLRSFVVVQVSNNQFCIEMAGSIGLIPFRAIVQRKPGPVRAQALKSLDFEISSWIL